MRGFRRSLNVLILFGAIAGCSGQVYTVEKDGKYVKGITAYPPKLYIDTYRLTAYVHDGKLLRTTDGSPDGKRCEAAIMQNLVVRPDYSSPYQIVYEPGMLEGREFSVSLKDGMLTAVNIKSTPDHGETLKNLLPTIAELGGAPMGLAAPDDRVLCNANPILRDIVPYHP